MGRWRGSIVTLDRDMACGGLFLAAAFQVAAADPLFGAAPDQAGKTGKKHHQQQEYKGCRPAKKGGDQRVPQEGRAAKRDDQAAGVDIAADHRFANQQRGQMPVRPELAENGAWRAGG